MEKYGIRQMDFYNENDKKKKANEREIREEQA